jgi:hypothetical protein
MREEYNFNELNHRKNPYIQHDNIFVIPAKIGSLVWIVAGRNIKYGVVEGYKIAEHGAYCYGSISEPRDDDPDERIWVDNFGIDVNDFGKTMFLQDKVSFEEVQKIVNELVPYDANNDEALCEGCLSKNCDICPQDDGYKCRGCPCDTCKVVDGKRTNWYDSYNVRYGD